MKKYTTPSLLVLGMLAHMSLLAQDIDIDLADDSPEIFENPIFWVAVAAVLILIVVLTRRKK